MSLSVIIKLKQYILQLKIDAVTRKILELFIIFAL